MLKFEKNIEERKFLATRIGELTGQTPVYTRAPYYAYTIGDYTVDRDGNLLVDENIADAELLTVLLREQLIKMPDLEGGDETEGEMTEPTYEQDSEEEITEEMEEEEGLSAEPFIPEPVIMSATESESEEQDDSQTEEVSQMPVTDEQETAEAPQEQEASEAAAQEEQEAMELNIALPLEEHTGTSLRNLVRLLYSRGPAINRATGADFHVEKELVDALEDDTCTFGLANFRKALADYEAGHGGSGIRGLELTEDKVVFSGFTYAEDENHVMAYAQLAALMCQMAISQKRVQARIREKENDKYGFRIWLLRMGMNGEEFKQTRKILLKNLEGHSAFRTDEEADRAKAKAKRKREAQKAARVADGGAIPANVEVTLAEPESPTQGEPVGDSEGVSEDDAIPMF